MSFGTTEAARVACKALADSLNVAEKAALKELAGGGGSSRQQTTLQLVRDGIELTFISIVQYE